MRDITEVNSCRPKGNGPSIKPCNKRQRQLRMQYVYVSSVRVYVCVSRRQSLSVCVVSSSLEQHSCSYRRELCSSRQEASREVRDVFEGTRCARGEGRNRPSMNNVLRILQPVSRQLLSVANYRRHIKQINRRTSDCA